MLRFRGRDGGLSASGRALQPGPVLPVLKKSVMWARAAFTAGSYFPNPDKSAIKKGMLASYVDCVSRLANFGRALDQVWLFSYRNNYSYGMSNLLCNSFFFLKMALFWDASICNCVYVFRLSVVCFVYFFL